VEGVVHDRNMLELRIVAHRIREALVHVHRKQLELRLLSIVQPVEPFCERLFTAPFADPNGLSGREIAYDGDELLGARVATAEVLLVDADLAKRCGWTSFLPALNGCILGASHGSPVQPVQRGDM
jgi:hypothetical protein